MKRVFYLLLFFLSVFFNVSFAADYYVDVLNGLDSNDGISWISSLKTIKAAYDKIGTDASNIIYIAQGEYNIANQGVNCDEPENGDKAILKITKKNVTLKGVGRVIFNIASTPGISQVFIINNDNVTIENIEFCNLYSTFNFSQVCIKLYRYSDMVIKNNKFYDIYGGAIQLNTGDGYYSVNVEKNLFYNCNSTVRTDALHLIDLSGFGSISSPTHRIVFKFNTIYNCITNSNSNLLHIEFGPSEEVYDNIFYITPEYLGTSTMKLLHFQTSRPNFNNNLITPNRIVYGSGQTPIYGPDGIDRNLYDVTPQFIDALTSNFHLKSTSPCVLAGTENGTYFNNIGALGLGITINDPANPTDPWSGWRYDNDAGNLIRTDQSRITIDSNNRIKLNMDGEVVLVSPQYQFAEKMILHNVEYWAEEFENLGVGTRQVIDNNTDHPREIEYKVRTSDAGWGSFTAISNRKSLQQIITGVQLKIILRNNGN